MSSFLPLQFASHPLLPDSKLSVNIYSAQRDTRFRLEYVFYSSFIFLCLQHDTLLSLIRIV